MCSFSFLLQISEICNRHRNYDDSKDKEESKAEAEAEEQSVSVFNLDGKKFVQTINTIALEYNAHKICNLLILKERAK